jgi:hypothetical protein
MSIFVSAILDFSNRSSPSAPMPNLLLHKSFAIFFNWRTGELANWRTKTKSLPEATIFMKFTLLEILFFLDLHLIFLTGFTRLISKP